MGANVGQAVFNVAGLVVSYYFGPLAGALVATAGQALFPAGGNIKGPRAQDQGFTTSQAGLDIPLVIGTQKVAGNVIWAGPLVEHKKSQSAKGGGPKATTYTYTRSFALLLCEGPITGVRRIWRNGKIIYDRTPQGDDESDADFRERDAANTQIETQLRVYQGTEDQLPDPLQEADKGVGNVPAYRGLAYLTFENHDITDMGGRVPNFESEVVEVGTNLTNADPEYRQEFLAPWVKALHPENCKNEHEYNGGVGWKSTLDEALFDAGGISNYYGWAVGPLLVYPYFDVDPEENKILELHFNTYNVSRRYGTLDPPCGDAILCCELNTVYPGPVWWTGMNTGGASSGSQHPGVYFTGAGGSTGVVQNCLDENNDPWYSVTIEYDITINVRRVPSKPGTLCNPLCALSKPLLPEDSRFCVLDDGSLSYAGPLTKSDASTSWKILVDPLPYEAPDGSIAHLPAIPDWDDRYSDQEFWEAAAAAAILKGIEIPTGLFPKPVYGIHYPVTKVGPTWKVLQKYTESGSDVAKYPLGPALPDFDSRYSDSDFWTTAYTQAKVTEGTAWPQGIPEGLVYGSNYPVTQSYAYARVPPDLQAMYSDDVTLAHAVTRIAERCALSADQIDVSELTETLTGIRVASNGSGRTVIQQLQQYGFFDAVEVDGLLRFPLRGKTHVATLDEDELGAHNPGEDVPPLATLERAEPAELPKQLNVKFDDVNNEYQVGQQSAMWLTDDASSIQDVELAIAMDSQKAAQIADVAISTIWWSRESVQFAAMPNWLKLAAGDAILVPIEGRYERVHIDSAEMPLPTGVIAVEAARDDSAVYASYKTGAPVVRVPPRPGVIGPTLLTVLDIPALREADDDAGFYVALRGAMSGWKGATLQISTDGQATWNTVTDVTLGAIVGTASTALPAGPTAIFDRGNQLVVTLASTAELQSITEDQVLNYGNAAAYGADGRWEILQFAAATNNGDGTWTLSTLLRGRKGTEWAVGLHEADDAFVLLGDGLVRVPLGAAAIGKIISLRAVSLDLVGDAGTIVDEIPRAVALECYSPCYLRSDRQEDGDIRIRFARRTRIAGEWLDYADVPLNEESERYEIDILDGLSVIRTLSISASDVFYTASQISADFGTAPDTISVRIYQISATVGRGYVYEGSI